MRQWPQLAGICLTFPHTARATETKQCMDCHVSDANDNNAIMAQVLMHGTNFVNFVGYNAWIGRKAPLRPFV